ncbi:hypothetical protein C8J57DRAFT_1507588 [Mycena rebaudengoi]|nr:hypothetical protein C8J57DRAFT_1507588 [Mycena rebaudengoi]
MGIHVYDSNFHINCAALLVPPNLTSFFCLLQRDALMCWSIPENHHHLSYHQSSTTRLTRYPLAHHHCIRGYARNLTSGEKRDRPATNLCRLLVYTDCRVWPAQLDIGYVPFRHPAPHSTIYPFHLPSLAFSSLPTPFPYSPSFLSVVSSIPPPSSPFPLLLFWSTLLDMRGYTLIGGSTESIQLRLSPRYRLAWLCPSSPSLRLVLATSTDGYTFCAEQISRVLLLPPPRWRIATISRLCPPMRSPMHARPALIQRRASFYLTLAYYVDFPPLPTQRRSFFYSPPPRWLIVWMLRPCPPTR